MRMFARGCASCAVAATLLYSPAGLAAAEQEASLSSAPSYQWAISGGLGPVMWLFVPPVDIDSALVPEVQARVQWENGLEMGAGVRVALPGVAPDVFVLANMASRIGAWSPSMGIEFGASRMSPYGPLYVSLNAAPLRFSGERLSFSFLSLGIGTNVGSYLGRVVRIQPQLVQVTWRR